MLRRLLYLVAVVVIVALIAVVAIEKVLADDDLAGCHQPNGSELCRTADVIVAVSGGDTVARANKAIELYQAGWAPKIIFSGDSADPTAISNAEAMKESAIAKGVPADDILLDDTSRDTKENARNTVEILNKLEAKEVILVSSPYHLRRVRMNFVAADNKFAYRTAAADDKAWRSWFTSINGWRIAVTELAGMMELSLEVKK